MLSEVRVEVGQDRPLSTGSACVKDPADSRIRIRGWARLGTMAPMSSSVVVMVDEFQGDNLRSFESQPLNVVLRLENLSK